MSKAQEIYPKEIQCLGQRDDEPTEDFEERMRVLQENPGLYKFQELTAVQKNYAVDFIRDVFECDAPDIEHIKEVLDKASLHADGSPSCWMLKLRTEDDKEPLGRYVGFADGSAEDKDSEISFETAFKRLIQNLCEVGWAFPIRKEKEKEMEDLLPKEGTLACFLQGFVGSWETSQDQTQTEEARMAKVDSAIGGMEKELLSKID